MQPRQDQQSDRDPAGACTLVLVFKRPRPGHGKQRLAAGLGAEAACELAGLLLECALEDLAAWPGPVVLAPDDPADTDWAARRLPRAQVLAQGPGNLGERLAALDHSLRDAGHRQLIYLGSDSPGLGAGQLAAAARALAAHDVVLAPASDGGVVLMAARRPWPVLADLPWSTARLGAVLAARCREAGSTLAWSEGGSDVDTVADLAALADSLVGDLRPARRRLGQWLAHRR